MAIEEVWTELFSRPALSSSSDAFQEFSIEIPDKDADAIHTGMDRIRLSSRIDT